MKTVSKIMSSYKDNPLSAMIFESRSHKPRIKGITMMVDWGIPPAHQADLMSTLGPFVDLAKIAVGIGSLYSPEVLGAKLDTYRSNDITPFIGGMFIEHAVLHGKTREYLQAVVDSGFDCIEISDNLLEMDLDQKTQLIKMSRNDFGLRVIGEVGKKEGIEATADFAEDTARCLEAGSEYVFLEAADFFAGEVNDAALNPVIERSGLGPLIFELPGPWIKGITQSDVHQVTRMLIERFGADANIGNVIPDYVMSLEALRLKIGVNAGAEH